METGRGEGNAQSATNTDGNPENAINLTLLDPPRFGWTAAGGVADLLHPHEVSSLSRRISASVAELTFDSGSYVPL